MRMLRMPFGKYKGELLTELPDHYIEWLLAQEWLREPLLSAIRQEHAQRTGGGDDGERDDVPPMVREVCETGYRTLAPALPS